MITQVIDRGNTIRLISEDKQVNGLDEIYDLEKGSGIKIKYLRKDNYINIWDEARRMFFTIKHEEVVSPITANARDLYERIAEFLRASNTVNIDSSARDAFGRTRVSELTTLIDIKHLHDKQPLLVDEVINGTASSAHSSDTASVTVNTSSDGDYVIRQTKQRLNYQNGKSQLILQTFSNFQNEDNITKRIGYFTSSETAPYNTILDGIFLESSNGTYSINVYRSGTPVFTVDQSNWNLDTMDGTGKSGIELDFTKSQILSYDFEWLGVGGIRFAFVIDNNFYYFHQTKNSNIEAEVYMSSPNKPLRWEIRQDGIGSGGFKIICSSVNSEGGINQVGRVLSYNVFENFLTATTAGNTYAALGVRLSDLKKDTVVNIIDFNTLAATSDNYLIELRFNPTVSNTFNYTPITDSSIEIAEGANNNTVTGGHVLFSSYGAGSTGGGGSNSSTGQGLQGSVDQAIRLGANIDGLLDQFVICITPLTSGLQIYTSVNWRELI